ncbi:MAG: hypothetical protein AAF449_09535 [Myxococcota bacterium]
MRRYGIILLLFAGLPIACGEGSMPEEGEMQTAVVQTLNFVRSADGLSEGFDLDGIETTGPDPRTCFKTDFTSPDGQAGVDNELSRLLPIIDLAGEGVLSELLQNAIDEGRLLMMFEVTRLDQDRARVRVRRGEDLPLLGTDGRLLPGQTLALHPTGPDLGEAEGTIVDGRIRIDSFALNVPVVVFSQLYEVFLPEARLTLHMPAASSEEPAEVIFGGGIPIEQLVTILQTASNFAREFTEIFGEAVRDSGDLSPDATGRCTLLSSALKAQLVSAFIWE